MKPKVNRVQDQTVTHVYGCSPEPLKVKLEKNTKGYQWEISASGNDISTILSQIRSIDQKLKTEYGGA